MVVDALTDEEGRLGALHRYGLPGIGPHEPLDRIARIAQAALGVPMATVSIVDRSRQIILAARGIEDAPISRDRSLCALALEDRRTLILPDCTIDARAAKTELVEGEMAVRSYLAVPLVAPDGYVLGCLEILDRAPREFTEDEMLVAVNLARLAMSYLATRQPDSFDSLTGALTRRKFQAEVEREFDRATRYERPAALVFLDIDGFRVINQNIGLQTADEIIKTISNRAMDSLRSTDSFGRIGGEEFAMLLPETLAYEASQCAERLREEIARLRFRDQNGVVSVTASFGIAPLNPDVKSAVDWFARADIALYGSKQAGQNCVTFAPAGPDADTIRADEARTPPANDRMH